MPINLPVKDMTQLSIHTSKTLTLLTPEEATKRAVKLAEQEITEQVRSRNVLMGKIAADLGPRYVPQRATLETFQIYHPAQREVLDQLRAINVPELIAAGGGLIFFGPVGTGKEHLAAAMLYLAAGQHGLSCRWIDGQDWFGAMRDRMGEGKAEEEILRSLSEPVILVISDPIPPRREPSPWNVEILLRLINRRYRHLKSTWATLNVADLDEASNKLSAPVFDRLRESSHFLKCFWPSFRERQ